MFVAGSETGALMEPITGAEMELVTGAEMLPLRTGAAGIVIAGIVIAGIAGIAGIAKDVVIGMLGAM